MPESKRKWKGWQAQLEDIKFNITRIATDFVGTVANEQHIWRLRYTLEEYLSQVRLAGIIQDYKIDELNREGMRILVTMTGALDCRIISMRWS